ncbi:MAG: thioredoxin family protein [Dysgonamonadaceae bacterium]|jgi:thiol:disulfide interchange protein DsbD|nr:thioredoxin family protein [Dysgonamonadaceae bacterium]
MRKQLYFIFSFFFVSFSLYAQMQHPVKWNYYINEKSEIIFTASVDNGWHLYTMDIPPGGPLPTSFVFETINGAELDNKVTTLAEIITSFDKLFDMDISWYKDNPTFTQKLRITNPDRFLIEGYIDYMSCNDENCIPNKEEFSFSENHLPASLIASVRKKLSKDKETVQAITSQPEENNIEITEETDEIATSSVDWWQPISQEWHRYGAGSAENDKSLLIVFLLCFGGGFIALLTPCVWPVIPMTVSFFLKRSKSNRKKAFSEAVIYGVSIIFIYLILGLLITLIFGASALNELSTGAVFNLIFFALLVLFAVSFFGAFEFTLPSAWTNKMNNKAESTTGSISIFFMAFTLVLVSFSCTGPIIGSLLVQAAGMESIIGPAIGMFGFGLALAIPFAFFAVFPSFLQSMPKSGGWLNSVKVVLGFLELALALKFFSVADLAYGWGILDREVFLVLWIVIFVLLGFYLLGKIRLPHDSDLKNISVIRLFLAIVSFAFAVYMVPGLWGAPLKAISAFSPPLYTQDFNLYDGEVHPRFRDYEEGMIYAQKQGKPVLIDFTGYGCVNCREMEASVWSDPRVKRIIDNDYILISLYVDDKTKLPKIMEVTENGKTRKLRTIGDKWSYLQSYKFGANAQPYYVLLDNEGMPIAPWKAYNTNIEEYVEFLRNGIQTYKSKNKNAQ